jgi:HAD superfamily hydrolase (TIGR01458 family)
MADIDGLLLDIDGVLATSWQPLPGSLEAMAWFRDHDVPFRLITNTTTHTRRDLAATLGAAGFDVVPDQIVTAVTATAAYLHEHQRGAPVYVLTDGDPGEDLDVRVVDRPEDADVVAIGGASDAFSYEIVNRIFRRVMDGAVLVGMHRNLYWRTNEGWELDGGAYVAAIEEATGAKAVICGKPSVEYFRAALRLLELPAERVAMVGDDVINDVMGAQAAGMLGVLVRTGKFQSSDLDRGTPDAVVDALGDIPGWLAR